MVAVELHAITDLNRPDEWAEQYLYDFLYQWRKDHAESHVRTYDQLICVRI